LKFQVVKKKITVFTTRADTLFGATFMVLAPEGKTIQDLKSRIENWTEVEKYIEKTKLKTELDTSNRKRKTGSRVERCKKL